MNTYDKITFVLLIIAFGYALYAKVKSDQIKRFLRDYQPSRKKPHDPVDRDKGL